MPRQIITTANAPSSPLYSQGVKAGPHVLVSGITGIDPSSGSLAGDTIQDQTRQALENCAAILQAGVPFRTSVTGEPRSALCGMGICEECRATINGVPRARTCQRVAEEGMEIVAG